MMKSLDSSRHGIPIPVTSFILEFCELVQSPRAVSVAIMVRYGLWDELIALSIDPNDYDDPVSFAYDLQVTSLLQKFDGLPLDIDRRQVALDSFWESEAKCQSMNRVFLNLPDHEFPGEIQTMKRLIQGILGHLTPGRLMQIESSFGFGPGATTGVRGRGSIAPDRYANTMQLTSSLVSYYRSILSNVWIGDLNWWELQKKPKLVQGSKLTTVPKNAKTDRPICIEPTLNIFVQKGIGAVLKKRLASFGFPIYDQDRNRKLASRAYKKALATIDMKAASDSISYFVVERLLPNDWFQLLDLCRSPKVLIDGKWHVLEKFSSMGNGYTFELETILFLALALACVPIEEWDDVSVFGDDVILPRTYASRYIELLDYLGFQVNRTKSFLEGNFFESCGSDYFRGLNVRPFFLRKENNHIPWPVVLANRLRVWCDRLGQGVFSDKRFHSLWKSLHRQSLHIGWPEVPASFGDMGVISDRPPKPIRKEGSYKVKYIQLRPKGRFCSHPGAYLMVMHTRSKSMSDVLLTYNPLEVVTKSGFPIRGIYRRLRPKSTSVWTWDRLADWS